MKERAVNQLSGAIAALTSCFALSSHAAGALGSAPPSAESVRSVRQVAPMAQADDSSSLRQGVVTALSPRRDWVYVNGTWLGVVEGRTRLFRLGKPVPAGALAEGQLLRFNLAPGRNDGTTLGVVYVP